MNRTRLLTTELIAEIKELTQTNSLRKVAELKGVSYYTAYQVKRGYYENFTPLNNVKPEGRNKKEVRSNHFNPDQHENWII